MGGGLKEEGSVLPGKLKVSEGGRNRKLTRLIDELCYLPGIQPASDFQAAWRWGVEEDLVLCVRAPCRERLPGGQLGMNCQFSVVAPRGSGF